MEKIDRATSVTVWGMVRGRRTEAVPVVGRVQFEVVRLKSGECVVDRQIWAVVSSYTVSLLGPPQTSVVFAVHPVEQSLSLNNEEVGIELLHQHSSPNSKPATAKSFALHAEVQLSTVTLSGIVRLGSALEATLSEKQP